MFALYCFVIVILLVVMRIAGIQVPWWVIVSIALAPVVMLLTGLLAVCVLALYFTPT